MAPVRVFIAGLSPMVTRFIADAIETLPDLVVVDPLLTGDDLVSAVAQEEPDLLILGLDAAAAESSKLLQYFPSVKAVLQVSIQGDRARIHARHSQPLFLRALTAKELVMLSQALVRERTPGPAE